MSVIIFKANRLYPYSMNMLMWSLHSRLRWLTTLEIKLPPRQWEILIEKKKFQYSITCVGEWKRKLLCKVSCCLAFRVNVGTAATLCYKAVHRLLYPIVAYSLSGISWPEQRKSFHWQSEISPVTYFEYVSGLHLHSKIRNVSSKRLRIVGEAKAILVSPFLFHSTY